MKKVIAMFLLLITVVGVLAGCTPAENASHNISAEADKFNVTRRITVVNMRTDMVMFEIEGTFSLKNNSTKELEIICLVGHNTYKKHFVYLNDWTSYVMEDISGANVDPYSYNIKIYPQIPNITIGE
jgi:ABC-type Fe3+-hydroxamate transport system substrate-binding protein